MYKPDKHDVIIIGETHGTEENIKVVENIYRNMTKSWKVTIGFEYPQSLVDNPDGECNDLLDDGRYSPIHKQFLKKLKTEKASIFGFDIPNDGWSKMPKNDISWRDGQMAFTVNKVLDSLEGSEKLLLVCGDAHFQTRPSLVKTAIGIVEFLPMAARLNISSIQAIHLTYLSGQFWNFRLREIKPYEVDRSRYFRPSDDVIEWEIKLATPTRFN